MEVKGKITGITYKRFLAQNLKTVEFSNFDINTMPTSCVVINGQNSFAISKWVSAKRSRSYPYERVYNTLNISKKITVIPVIKDEGGKGDRDFLQWDSISLMSLMDVFVILAYYDNAIINKKQDKITKQQFNNAYILSKINEIENYHSSALHWNLNELKNNLHHVIDMAMQSYKLIEKKTGIELHNFDGIEKFKNKIGINVCNFMQFSRDKAEQAQAREYVTIQPKENLTTLTKAKITITNYLGGQYFFTLDEIKVEKNILYIIESKHSKDYILPSKGDIKDGLVKMIRFSNLTDTTLTGININCIPVLKLTSFFIVGSITSKSSEAEIESFLSKNKFSSQQKILISTLFVEANTNKFLVNIIGVV